MKELQDTIEAIRQVPATEQGLEQMRNLFCHALTLVSDDLEKRGEAGNSIHTPPSNPAPKPVDGKQKKSGR